MKKVLSLVLALSLMLAVFVLPAAAATDYGSIIGLIPNIEPGDTRRDTEYSYAWLDQLIVRDDAMSVIATTLVPKPADYPYSHTYSEFVDESKAYCEMNTINEETVASSYEELMTLVYYSVVAMGMNDDYEVMAEYLRDYGIEVPYDATSEDKMNVTVTYAVLKYDALYALYGKTVSIPAGVTAEGAAVIILSSLSGIMLPSGVTSYTGLAVHSVKTFVSEFEELPISKNPDSNEVFYWAKVITASSSEYEVPGISYDMVDKAQKEYVDYAYFATILNKAYDIHLDPEALAIAYNSDDDLAVQRLLLETMLYEKNVSYDGKMSTEELFDYACEKGCFNLEEEFYTDVLNYDVTIAQNRTKIWFTPFSVADQLDGGNVEATTMTINGVAAGHNKTTGIALDPTKKNETISLTVVYNDGIRNQSAVYTFNIIKDASLNNAEANADNDLVAQVGSYASSLNPEGNEKVDEIMSGVMAFVEESVPTFTISDVGDMPTTFGQQSDITLPSGTQNGTDGYENSYLGELFENTYETDANGNIITTKGASFAGVEDDDNGGDSIIAKATTAVKENPEIVAAPTGIIALGALAGYLMTKKHRDSEMLMEVVEEDEEETEEIE